MTVFKIANPIETMTEDTVVSLAFDKERLYKNMVDAKADWLYELPQWDEIFDENTKKRLYREQKQSGTIPQRREELEEERFPLYRAEAARNIKNAVDVTHNRSFICGFIFWLSGSAVWLFFFLIPRSYGQMELHICRILAFVRRRSSQFVFCISEVSGECAYWDRRIDACRMGAFRMDRISDLIHCKESM